MFSHISDIPSVNDCLFLFFHMNKLTMEYALQLSMRTFKEILNFNPKDDNYHIPNTNTQLSHLLVIANTSTLVIYSE